MQSQAVNVGLATPEPLPKAQASSQLQPAQSNVRAEHVGSRGRHSADVSQTNDELVGRPARSPPGLGPDTVAAVAVDPSSRNDWK